MKKYLLITIALLISLFIYLFYRTDKTVVNELLIRVISISNYARLKARVVSLMPLSKLIIYSLPEGLWVFCITLTSKPYFIEWNNRRLNCVYIPLIYFVGLEFLQLLHITNGRFDFVDIWVSLLFWLLAGFILKDRQAPQNITAHLNLKATICILSYCIVYLAHVIK